MENVYKEITASELLGEISSEMEAVIEALGLSTEESQEHEDIKLHVKGIRLIAEAWKLPEEELQKALELLSETEYCEPIDGKEGMEIHWGLFHTAVILDSEEKRRDILELAKYSADFYALEVYVV